MPENDENKPQVDPSRALNQAYPANSKKAKVEAETPKELKPKMEPLELSAPAVKKGQLGKRIRTAFTGDDARGIGDYLLFEVALPAIKTTLFDLITGGANRALFGTGGTPGAANRRPGVVNYNAIGRNQPSNVSQQRAMSSNDQANHNFDAIVLPTRQDAEMVLSALVDVVEHYDAAAVSDLYDLVNVTGSYTDDKWGWFDLRGATILPVRGGFILSLPQTQPLR